MCVPQLEEAEAAARAGDEKSQLVLEEARKVLATQQADAQEEINKLQR